MAEIPIEKKSSMTWLWVLLAVILAVLLLWWVFSGDDEEVGVVAPAPATEVVGVQTPGPDPITAPEPVATEPGFGIAAILGSPSQFVGRNDFQAEVTAPEVPTDRGFWIEDQGQRLFAVLIDDAAERPLNINPGQQLRIREGMIRDATFINQIPGTIDADTRRILQGQDIFLVVDETKIEILSRAN